MCFYLCQNACDVYKLTEAVQILFTVLQRIISRRDFLIQILSTVECSALGLTITLSIGYMSSEPEPSSRGEPAVRSQIVDPRSTNAASASSSSRPAGGDNADPTQLMCRRYMIGKCKKARKCPFSHSMDHLPTTFCKDYIFSEWHNICY